MREIAQDYQDIRFTTGSMQAIQEAAEVFVTETFHKVSTERIILDTHTKCASCSQTMLCGNVVDI